MGHLRPASLDGALWKIAGRSALVHHLLSPSEHTLCDTDAPMTQRPLHDTAAA
jgi:hypothetical protein